ALHELGATARAPPRRGLLDGEGGDVCPRAGRRQTPGPNRRVQRRAPAVLARGPRGARPQGRADAAVAGQLLRVRNPDAGEGSAAVQPAQLPQRHDLAARQLADRDGAVELWYAEDRCACAHTSLQRVPPIPSLSPPEALLITAARASTTGGSLSGLLLP